MCLVVAMHRQADLLEIVDALCARAASRADCTAGSNTAIKTAMIATTTSNSINVKPRGRGFKTAALRSCIKTLAAKNHNGEDRLTDVGQAVGSQVERKSICGSIYHPDAKLRPGIVSGRKALDHWTWCTVGLALGWGSLNI